MINNYNTQLNSSSIFAIPLTDEVSLLIVINGKSEGTLAEKTDSAVL